MATEHGAAGTGAARSPPTPAACTAWPPQEVLMQATHEDDRTDPAFGSPILQLDQFSNTVDYIKNKYKVSF